MADTATMMQQQSCCSSATQSAFLLLEAKNKENDTEQDISHPVDIHVCILYHFNVCMYICMYTVCHSLSNYVDYSAFLLWSFHPEKINVNISGFGANYEALHIFQMHTKLKVHCFKLIHMQISMF